MLRESRVLIAFSRQPSVADFMKRILEDAGYEAIACFTTVEDLERAVSAHNPAAIVYEIAFPLVDELRRFREVRLRRTLARIPIVIATPAPADLYRRWDIDRALEMFTRPSRSEVDVALHAAIEAQRISDAA